MATHRQAISDAEVFIFVAEDISHAPGRSVGTNPTAAQIRSKLVRKALRKKKQDSIRSLQESLQVSNRGLPFPWRYMSTTQAERALPQMDTADVETQRAPRTDTILEEHQKNDEHKKAVINPRRRLYTPSGAVSLLGPFSPSGVDPFLTYPIDLDNDGLHLVAYCKLIPRSSTQGHVSDWFTPQDSRTPSYMVSRMGAIEPALRRMRDLTFMQALLNPITFQTTIVEFAARHEAEAYGVKETSRSLKQKNRTIQMLNKNMESSSLQLSDDTVMAVTSTALLEVSKETLNPGCSRILQF